MKEFDCKLMDLNIRIRSRYEYVQRQCEAYQAAVQKLDLYISCTDEEIQAERGKEDSDYEPGYLESLAVYRKISQEALKWNGFLMHGAVVAVKEEGYAFLAPSGTGKSTHVRLWQNYIPEPVVVVNGDKPLVRMEESEDGTVFFAYGTPWCGKEGWNTNRKVPLKGICFLEQAQHNEICRISREEGLKRLFLQVLQPDQAEQMIPLWKMLDRLSETVSMYLMRCNISEEAAVCSYQMMTGKKRSCQRDGIW